MNVESLAPFLLIIAPFLLAFLLEAIIIYSFKLAKFWQSLALAVLINLVTGLVLYFGAGAVLELLGYDLAQFNGLQLQIQVLVFLFWMSIVADGLLMILLFRNSKQEKIFIVSGLMNLLSYLFLYIFILNSH